MKRFIALCAGLLVLGLGGLDGAFGQKKKDASVPVPPLKEIPNIIMKLKDADPKVRAQSAASLGARGQLRARDIKDAVEPLIEMVKKDSDAEARRAAALALSKADADPELVLEPLVAALKDDKDDKVRAACATALGSLGTGAKEAVAVLREVQAMAKAGGKDEKGLAKATAAALKQITAKK